MNFSIRAAATAMLFSALALPVASQAAATTSAAPQHYEFQARLFDQLHAGEHQGQPALTIYRAASWGNYRPYDGTMAYRTQANASSLRHVKPTRLLVCNA